MKVEDVAKPKDPAAAAQPSGTGVANGPPQNPDFERLVRLVHADPHTVLGTHPVPGGVAVRAFRPNATAITVQIEGLPSVEMKRVHPAGIFEAVVPGRRDVPPYRFEVRYADGKSFTLRDPYAHLPMIGQMDLHLAGEGRHERIQDRLGAHPRVVDGVPGVSFAVWAPNSRSVSVVGSFNGWDGRLNPMRSLGTSGIWELFIPDIRPGALYKWEIRTGSGHVVIKADPYARYSEVPPGTASIVFESKHTWGDAKWMTARKAADPLRRPLSIYEVHLGSWRRVPEDGDRSLTFREIAPMLADYVIANGFTHVQLMPIMEHPFGGSWGYQVTGYFATTSRMGNPDDFRWMVDHLHQRGVGVIADWVPAHFPKDAWALGRFNGEALYEHLDPRLGEHPDWGTYIFNFGRNEVRNFLLASALFWLEEFHLDGLRVDAVASMLYLDYSRKDGEWIPNRFGGRENLEAITFIKEMNELAHAKFPGTLMIAEESTAWPGVSRPTYAGGLGFGFKWNMGWMHDTLSYFEKDPIHRRYHHNNLTFGLLYAWSENFVLPLSHDEVVHGKKSLIDKMPGDRWQKFANLRALYAYMWAHPGKKMIFMGDELGQWREWSEKHSLDWDVLLGEDHAGVQRLIRDLNRLYQAEPALWEADHESAGFEWIDANNADENVIAFRRMAPKSGRQLVCVCNFSPLPRTDYRIGLPKEGEWREVINTDATGYGGANVGNAGAIHAKGTAWHGKPYSAVLTLPPLAVLWFSPA